MPLLDTTDYSMHPIPDEFASIVTPNSTDSPEAQSFQAAFGSYNRRQKRLSRACDRFDEVVRDTRAIAAQDTHSRDKGVIELKVEKDDDVIAARKNVQSAYIDAADANYKLIYAVRDLRNTSQLMPGGEELQQTLAANHVQIKNRSGDLQSQLIDHRVQAYETTMHLDRQTPRTSRHRHTDSNTAVLGFNMSDAPAQPYAQPPVFGVQDTRRFQQQGATVIAAAPPTQAQLAQYAAAHAAQQAALNNPINPQNLFPLNQQNAIQQQHHAPPPPQQQPVLENAAGDHRPKGKGLINRLFRRQ